MTPKSRSHQTTEKKAPAQDHIASLTFTQPVAASQSALWQAWTAPAARSVWASPSPSVTVEFLETASKAGQREVSVCKVEGQADIRCEWGWLVMEPVSRSINYELLSSEEKPLSAALTTALVTEVDDANSQISVTIQLSSLAVDMEAGYREGFTDGLKNLASVAERTMIMTRIIEAPLNAVWSAWTHPDTLPQWWGPDGFSCRTKRIDLRSGGEWVFDMIGPDGTVYPNHHLYTDIKPQERIVYTLLWGENGPKHANAWAAFESIGEATRVTLGMILSTQAEFDTVKSFGAEKLGLQTLGKLEMFVLTR